MPNEMMLRYLYYLTDMSAGTKEWKRNYEAWRSFSHIIGDEEYERCLKELKTFDAKYRIKNT